MRKFPPLARRTLLAGLPLGLLAACTLPPGGGAAPPATPLRGTLWLWVPLQGAVPTTLPAPGPRTAHLQLADQELRAAGSTGCNRFSGSFALDGPRLRFGQVVSTRMACLEPDNPEPAFLGALQAARGWRIEGRTLWLTDERAVTVARFAAA